MDFLGLKDKNFLVAGLANRKSIAWYVGKSLEECGAKVIYLVRSPDRKASLETLLEGREAWICDVEDEEQIHSLAQCFSGKNILFDGFVHSIAFANYSRGIQPFHGTLRKDFLQAMTISCFSLVELSRALRPFLKKNASVVAMGISSQVTAENYGYMSPIKAALESTVRFLAKSLSRESEIRFNCVKSSPLKTSASAGIPGYIEQYLYAEQMTLRKRAVTTQEVANTVLFLLSPRSSGINGQGIVINAGMDMNYFDHSLVYRQEGESK
ncbi:MAG: SDR family oxidoreductase [Puniceicoccales bacterium]|jgi:enoyl-[acyl-carrier protein] reductase I|nr:SDR family oxidoreductase [Puniceicoccales bacterium]